MLLSLWGDAAVPISLRELLCGAELVARRCGAHQLAGIALRRGPIEEVGHDAAQRGAGDNDACEVASRRRVACRSRCCLACGAILPCPSACGTALVIRLAVNYSRMVKLRRVAKVPTLARKLVRTAA